MSGINLSHDFDRDMRAIYQKLCDPMTPQGWISNSEATQLVAAMIRLRAELAAIRKHEEAKALVVR